MKTNKEIKEKAIYLRKNEGLSYGEIQERLGAIPKSTLSGWLSDVKLNKKQKHRLKMMNPSINNIYRKKSGETNSKNHADKRKAFQEQGQEKAKKENKCLHLAGCMLYWAEGAKSRNSIKFTNTDPYMIKLFLKFLYECFNLSSDNIKIICHSHVLSDQTLEDVEEYWIKELDLPKSCLRKGSVERRIPKKKKIKYQNGICSIAVDNTEILHKIYGSIKEYASITDEDMWIF